MHAVLARLRRFVPPCPLGPRDSLAPADLAAQCVYRLGAALERHAGLRVTRVRHTASPAAGDPARAGRPAHPSPAVRPPADPVADRLLVAPVFVLSAPRSGSTLLRVVLDSHSELHAPIETHVRRLAVRYTTPMVAGAMNALGHNPADVQHLLWDRVLHRELLRSGKATLVEKTPSNVFVAERFARCWPDARFVFLLRHPLSIARSWHEADPVRRPMSRAVPHTLKYMAALERARQSLPGTTVRYERLTADPAAETRRLCAELGIPWEPGMLSYGRQDHGAFRKGAGDWQDKIRSGIVLRGRPLPAPEEVPEELREMCRRWGYLPVASSAAPAERAGRCPRPAQEDV